MSDHAFEGWAILELMGHRRLAGYLKAQELAGASFIRIDVPEVDGQAAATQFYAPAAVYCITPTSEDIATRFAAGNRPAPVSRWDLPTIEAPTPRIVERDDDQEEFEDLPFD